MAKDYFQDIIPSADGEGSHRAGTFQQRTPQAPEESFSEAPAPDRSIRNINIAPRARSPMVDVRGVSPLGAGSLGTRPSPRRERRSWLWILAALAVLALAILALLFLFRKTTVTVIPQSQPVVFNQITEFTAYPAQGAASNTLSYTVRSNDFQDSEVVPSSGVQHSETKAEGSIIVVNNYSALPVRLVKNTRFAAPGELVFRVPAETLVPAKGSSPGKVSVAVVADKAGAAYNIGPTARFTLPGLRSNAAMYKDVYAYSSASMTGGFSGDQPAVAASAQNDALAVIDKRIQDKVDQFKKSITADVGSVAIWVRASSERTPDTNVSGTTVRIHRAAHVVFATISVDSLAQSVAQTVAANASGASVTLKPIQDGFTINLRSGDTGSPITFAIGGHALLTWKVDTNALAQALAGRNSGAFQTIVSNFPGVQSARARIEPFWESTFPSRPADIHITVEAPKATQ